MGAPLHSRRARFYEYRPFCIKQDSCQFPRTAKKQTESTGACWAEYEFRR
jgi:hypothetical protein